MRRIWVIVPFAALVLSACGSPQSATPTEPTPLSDEPVAKVVSATGVVVPAQWATLSMPAGGIATTLPVEVGDSVKKGERLVALSGTEQAESALAAARLELVIARQALTTLQEQAGSARAQAEKELANARETLRLADNKRRNQQQGQRAASWFVEGAEANLVLADEEVRLAEDRYGEYSGRGEDDPQRALALSNLAAARLRRDAVQRELNWYSGKPTELQQALLDSDVAVAQARVNEAERVLERMGEGPEPRALEAAQGRLANAEAAVAAAQAALDHLELRAPFDGTVGALYVRSEEWVSPGQPILVLGDLRGLRVETTDLNEIDAARVKVGNLVTVTFDALPDVVAEGRVSRLAPKPSPGTGVNYTAVIEIEEIPPDILWGMTAFVDIQVDD
jgi:multidrug efflux pump subunit AcrA (membrane-fusion protein)